MNQEAVNAWIAGLESGDYTQTTEALKRMDGGLCCLGVLCEVYNKFNPNTAVKWVLSSNDDNSYAPDYSGKDYGCLPERVKEWAGLKSATGAYGDISGESFSHSLAYDNDYRAFTFQDIADMLKEPPKGLFE